MKILFQTLAAIGVLSLAVFTSLQFSEPSLAGRDKGGPPAVTVADFAGTLPATLHELGMFADLRTLEPASGVLAYDVNFPLWSDGAHKLRHAFIPPGRQIALDDDGQFVFPDGSVFSKTFELDCRGDGDERRIETRILAKHDGRWQYGVYLWNDGATAAVLSDGKAVDTGLPVPGGAKTYEVPSRMTCLQCHAGAPDVAVGFEAYQLSDSTLEILAERGQLPVALADLPHRNVVASTPQEREAIGYLAGNCAHCHNPRSSAYVGDELDLRHFKAARALVGREAHRLSRPGITKLVDPGAPESSAAYRLFERSFLVREGLSVQMPPIGNQLVDPRGRELLRSWIETLSPEAALATPDREIR